METSISIDVPDLDAARDFYTHALGFTAQPARNPYIEIVQQGTTKIYLLKTEAGTNSTPDTGTENQRHWQRHWTPVHLDFSTDDLNAAVARVVSAGGSHEGGKAGAIAHCCDPFGHGFCLIAS